MTDSVGLMNDTKWDEVRLAMYDLGEMSPKWRTRDVENGYVSTWDGEWFYHFREAGYRTIEWVEIATGTDEQREAVRNLLRRIHVPGVETEYGFRVYGHVAPGQQVDYL
jgi:hypothetical protein